MKEGTVSRFFDDLGVRYSGLRLLDTANAQSLLSLQYFLYPLVIALSFLVIVPPHDLLDPQLDDLRDIAVELVVLGKLGDFASEFRDLVLSLEKLIMIINGQIFPVLAACIGFLFVGRAFESEYAVDVRSREIFGIFGIFDLEGVIHHEEEVIAILLVAEDAVVILKLAFRLLHYMLLL